MLKRYASEKRWLHESYLFDFLLLPFRLFSSIRHVRELNKVLLLLIEEEEDYKLYVDAEDTNVIYCVLICISLARKWY